MVPCGKQMGFVFDCPSVVLVINHSVESCNLMCSVSIFRVCECPEIRERRFVHVQLDDKNEAVSES